MTSPTPRSEESSGTHPGKLSATAAGAIIAIIAVLVLTADQSAKYAVVHNLPRETPVHVIGNVLVFYYIRNSGAAFSLGEGVTWVFTIALTVVAIAIVWLMITRVRSRAWAITLGCLLGGVLGNLGDRLFRAPGFPVGHVVDFISTPWLIPAIYNVADSFIVCSMIAVALLVVIGVRMDGTRERKGAKADAAPDAPADAGSDTSSDAGSDAPQH